MKFHEQRTMAYMFPSMPRKTHPELFKQKIVRAAMKAYWPLRMAGFDYLLTPIILWASIN
ncbi:MAG: hypothetical protein ACLP9D_12585 [Candidatus Bathyarchaeia archaeon]